MNLNQSYNQFMLGMSQYGLKMNKRRLRIAYAVMISIVVLSNINAAISKSILEWAQQFANGPHFAFMTAFVLGLFTGSAIFMLGKEIQALEEDSKLLTIIEKKAKGREYETPQGFAVTTIKFDEKTEKEE